MKKEIKMKNQKGITMISLIVTIVVILILAGITINTGTGILQNIQLESIKTNLMLIEAKAKGYVEEVDFKIGVNQDSLTEEEYNTRLEAARTEIYGGIGLQKVSSSQNVELPLELVGYENDLYYVSESVLTSWGLDDIELSSNENYLIKFNEKTQSVEVYNTKGFDGKYSLTDIEKIDI